jgi:O-antigen ligase
VLELVATVLLAAALVAIATIVRDPKWLLPAVVVGLPIEYFTTQAVDTLGTGGTTGAIRALLNPGKAAMLATILVAMWRCRHEPQRLVPDSAVLLPVTAFLALIVAGLLWSDSLRPPNMVLILPMYVAFLFAAPSMIEGRRDVERILLTFLVVAIGLSVLGIAQRVAGVFAWRGILVAADGVSYRSNATFADPNNLARYLVVCITLATAMLLVRGPTRATVYVAAPALALALVCIVATASRSGWLMLMLCGALTVLVIPIARGTKVRIFAGAGGAALILVAFLLFQGGADAQRIASLASGVEVLGVRQFLIKAGWAMWKDNWLVGVGSGNFQRALVVSYIDYLPTWARTTLSHTSFISLLAELGIVGAAMFFFLVARIWIAISLTFHRLREPFDRMTVGWLGVALLGILLQSQSEGRLLDEPYVWLLLALVIAFETGFGRETALVAKVRPVVAAAPAGTAMVQRQAPAPGET